MRIFLFVLSGFVLTLTLFAGGVATAVYFLSADPVENRSLNLDTAEVWTNEPVDVDTASQDFDRLPADPVPQPAAEQAQAQTDAEEPENVANGGDLVDMTTTAAIPSEAVPEPRSPADDAASAAHVAWCSERYRSYRPGANSYTAYSGEQRECVSPYSDVLAASAAPTLPEEAGSYDEASVDQPLMGYTNVADGTPVDQSVAHVRSCFERYRSYRMEDNTYQPFGGGPRQQCQ